MRERALAFSAMIMLTFARGVATADDPGAELERHVIQLEQQDHDDESIPHEGIAEGIYRGWLLAERGKHREAAAVLTELLKDEMASDWRRLLTTQLGVYQKWSHSGTIELSDYRRLFLEGGLFPSELKPIIAVWRLNGVDEAEKCALLLDLFRRRGDREGERLVLMVIATSASSSKNQAAGALLELGDLYNRLEQHDKASSAWKRVKARYPETLAWGRAVYNLGLLHKKNGEYALAITTFSLVLDAKVSDLGPGASVMAKYTNWNNRSFAQWAIGNCLFAQKKYGDALEAYRRTEAAYPFHSTCGNAFSADRYWYAFAQGLCMDWLRDTRAAVRLYFKAIRYSSGLYFEPLAHFRIVDLYETTGQTEDLRRLLDAIVTRHLLETRRRLQGRMSDEHILRYSPTQVMRRILDIRATEKIGDWEGLISFLKIKGPVAGPEEAYARRENWEATEAARLLAMHTDAAVPRLLAGIAHADTGDAKWLYYALGRCGTEEAVRVLKEDVSNRAKAGCRRTIVYSLALADEKGGSAAKAPAGLSENNFKGVLLQHRMGDMGHDDEIVSFPELHGIPILPRTLQELAIVETDTPSGAVKARR